VGAFLINTSGHNQPTVAAVLHDKVGAMVTVTDITQMRTQVRSVLTSFNLTGLTRLELTFAVLLALEAGGLVLAKGFAERRAPSPASLYSAAARASSAVWFSLRPQS
jgi:putative ABC transport system permease protein